MDGTIRQLKIIKIAVNKNFISYSYTINGDWAKCFNLDKEFFIEYSEDISAVPQSIAVIPFLCNILPVVWVMGAEIFIPELDKNFYEHVDEIKRGYIEMYPKMNFGGKLTVEKIVDNGANFLNSDKAAAFFSGGVDSFSTLINHIDERPTLLTLWGSDVKLQDFKGWERVKNHAVKTAEQFKCKNLFIKSSFRQFLNEGILSQVVYPLANDGWWHGFQHGIGIISHAAPYIYCNKISKIYFASSFTERYKGMYTCASDPSIDNYLHVGECQTIHDGYNFDRQDKIHIICEYRRKTNEKINLHVCWISDGGQNCCQCEKCYRTICAILAESENPENYGFTYSPETVSKMYKNLKDASFIKSQLKYVIWASIIERFNKVPQNWKNPEIQKWTEGGDFSIIEQYFNDLRKDFQ